MAGSGTTGKEILLAMLKEKPRTTGEFLKRPPIAAEYRRIVCDLRRDGHNIVATPIRRTAEGHKTAEWLWTLAA